MTTLSDGIEMRFESVDKRQRQSDERISALLRSNMESSVLLGYPRSRLSNSKREEEKVDTTDPGFSRSKAVTKVCTALSTFGTCVDVNGGTGTSISPDQVQDHSEERPSPEEFEP